MLLAQGVSLASNSSGGSGQFIPCGDNCRGYQTLGDILKTNDVPPVYFTIGFCECSGGGAIRKFSAWRRAEEDPNATVAIRTGTMHDFMGRSLKSHPMH